MWDLFIFASVWSSQLPGADQLQADSGTHEGGSAATKWPSCCFHPSQKRVWKELSLGDSLDPGRCFCEMAMFGHHVGAQCFPILDQQLGERAVGTGNPLK